MLHITKRYFIAGTGTDVGKSVVSAILMEALAADYWKPISCGPTQERDSMKIRKWVQNPDSRIHKEIYNLSYPASPHYAAAKEGISLNTEMLVPPYTSRPLIIEGVGGVLVPTSNNTLFIDLLPKWNCEVIVVSRHYVGAINHTLLTIQALQQAGLNILGIIFNGTDIQDAESFILNYTGLPCLARLKNLGSIDKESIQGMAKEWEKLLSRPCFC